MVKVEKNYLFELRAAKLSLKDIFEGRRHSWSIISCSIRLGEGLPGCTSYANASRSQHAQQMRHHLCHGVARAAGQARGLQGNGQGWTIPWSRRRQRFQLRLSCTNDEKVAPIEYNYRNKAELETAKVPTRFRVRSHGLSVFFTSAGCLPHLLGLRARTEALTDSRALLDMTPYGRQQDF